MEHGLPLLNMKFHEPRMKAPLNLRCFFHGLFSLLVMTSLALDAWAGPGNAKFYFYSSETNINNYKSLKMEFDMYLSKFGPDKFQPFDSRESFQQAIKDRKNCLLFISSWHYANIQEEYGLCPLLVGERDGKNRQKKLLVSRNSVDLQTAKAGRIASASSIRQTKIVLKEIFGDDVLTAPPNILTVPKDMDALMSICFGTSSLSALTTENSLEKIKKTNPVLAANIKILAETGDSLLLIMCAPREFMGEAEKISQIILKMPSDPVGAKLIKMMGLDGWQKITQSDEKYLMK